VTAVDRLRSAWELYRRTAASRTAILLLLANLIPLVGVLFFDWSLLTILVLYWLENGIVGLWNVPKIILAQGSLVAPLPDIPDSAARAATRSEAEAAALQERRRTQAARVAQAAREVPSPTGPATSGLIGPRAAARLSAIPRTGLAVFFAFHYGMFWFVHGIFVFALPTFAGVSPFGGGPFGGDPFGGGTEACFDSTGVLVTCPPGVFGDLLWPAVVIGAIALFLSHGASFVLNYLGRGEYLTASPSGQMGSVYGRVVVLHITIILGSLVVAFLGSPLAALLVLIALKTAFDLGLHLRERRRAGPPRRPAVLASTAAVPSPPPAGQS
jgi:hypothetical protein